MEGILKQNAIRDQFRRKLWLKKTPEERMRVMARLQKRLWAKLRSSPEDYDRFLRRNFRARAISGWDQKA